MAALIISVRSLSVSRDNHRYKKGDRIPLFANTVYPLNNKCICPHPRMETTGSATLTTPITNRTKSFEEVFEGDCFTNTLYQLNFKVEKIEETLCEKNLSKEEVEKFRHAVRNNFEYKMYHNNIQIRGKVGNVEEYSTLRVCILFGLAYRGALYPCNYDDLSKRILLIYSVTSVVSGYVATSFHTVGTMAFLGLGGIIGYAFRPSLQSPCGTSRIPSLVPQLSWYLKTPAQMFLGGLLPFMFIFQNMDILYAGLWKHKVCGAFNTLFTDFIILIFTTIIVGIVFTAIQLSKRDQQWWWRSVFRGGSTAIFVYAYDTYTQQALPLTIKCGDPILQTALLPPRMHAVRNNFEYKMYHNNIQILGQVGSIGEYSTLSDFVWPTKEQGQCDWPVLTFTIVIWVVVLFNATMRYLSSYHNRSVFRGGSTSIFVYAYGIYFYVKANMYLDERMLILFLGYNACICYGLFLILGTIGFHSSSLVFRYIYGEAQKNE
ncbi:hypothetical protein HYC85_019555 [Camellia sinensis]|uniref:Transmembrane 9 superfamily member n=1 Tax=Camellia sinensis TaxID=4442 RepID=A0A7J7GM70_CAMSI|nr:hypothetical protein HYC85_019555 [Camellia sinensis]